MNYATMVRRRRLIEAVLYTSENLYESSQLFSVQGTKYCTSTRVDVYDLLDVQVKVNLRNGIPPTKVVQNGTGADKTYCLLEMI